MHSSRARYAIAVLAAFTAVAVAVAVVGCSGSGGGAAVPSLSQGPGAQGTGGAGSRAGALHAAAQCIRQYGIPAYTDPVLTPGGAVYTDSRSFEDVSRSIVTAVDQACGTLMTEASLHPEDEPPAPAQLVQAGVRAAECLRAHGLPHVADPTARSPYTPGHGFGMNASEIPPGGKRSPVWQHARQACSPQVDAEIQASTLGSLGNDG